MRFHLRRALVGLVAIVTILGASPAASISLVRDAEIERTLRQMSSPIFRAAGLDPGTVNLYMVNSRSLNAFVAGGRNIFLFTGLMSELETPEELLGVIAHETGHISGGHLARRAINVRNAQGPALLGLLLGIAAGAAGGGDAGTAVLGASQDLVRRSLLRFNRGEEAAADQAALSYLERSGINPEGLLRVVERFRGQEVLSIGSVDPYVQSHPIGAQRTSLLQSRIAANAGRTWPEDVERTYWHTRLRAKLEGFLDDPRRVLDTYADAPETEFTLYAQAIALHRLPATSEAIATVNRLISLRPKDPFYIELRGQILLESGRAEQAIPDYREAVRLAPREALLKAGLGRALLQLNEPGANAEALAVLQDARNADLGDASALRDLALAYARAGDTGMAALATAERLALGGNLEDAALQAGRASTILPEGSPGWLRAQDIIALRTRDN